MPRVKQSDPQLLSVRNAALFLGVSTATIRLWAQSGRLQGGKVGSRGDWRFTKTDLQRMIRKNVESEVFTTSGQKTTKQLFQFETIFKHIAEGITVQDPSGNLLFANDTAARILGFSSANKLLATSIREVVGRFEVLDEEGNPFPFDRLPGRQALAGKKPKQVVVRFRVRQTGEERWSIVNATPVYENGKVIYAINVFRDITEYQLTRERLKENQERYRQFLRLTTEGIWRFELEKPLPTSLSVKQQIKHMYANAYLAECNDAMAKMYGYKKAKDIIGARLSDMLISSDEQNIAYLSAFITSGYSLNDVESHEIDKYGNDKFFSNSLTGIVENGMVLRAWGIQRDITERKAAEKAIADSEARFKTLTSAAPVGIFKTDLDGNCLYVNKRWCDFAGITPEEAKGKGWIKALHPADKDRIFRERQKVAKKKTEFSSEYRFKSPKGKVTWLYGNAIAIRNAEGKETGYLGTISDITERKATDDAIRMVNAELQKEIATLNTFIEVLPIGVAITTDPDCRYVRINKRHAMMLGIPSDENASYNKYPPGKAPWKTIRDGREITADERMLEMTIKHKRSYSDIKQTYVRKDGKQVEVLAYGAPLVENGQVAGAIGAYLDVTKLRELERQKDDFLGIASHELKTPVTSLKAYGQVLQHTCKKSGDERSHTILKKMDAQIDKLTALIGDLLDVTKIEGGKLMFHKHYFYFDELVDEVIEAVQLTTDKHTIQRVGETKKRLFTDRERVGQVITNFLTNAIKYSPNASDIIVRIETKEGSLQLSVTDYGIGIPKDKHDKIFSRFYRGSDKKTTTFPGLGLGLYISSEIIRRLHGRIWFESKERKGTTFAFSLPLTK